MRVPVIDVTPFVRQTSTIGRAHIDTAHAIRDACNVYGFFTIKGHGVQPQLMREIREVSRTFFDLDQSIKGKVSVNNFDPPVRGYQVLGQNHTQGAADFHEGFDIYTEQSSYLREDLTSVFRHPNQWPQEMPELKQTCDQYVPEMIRLGNAIMSAIALGLDKPVDFFKQYYTEPFWMVRLLRYSASVSSEKSQGVGEHTDYGFLTFVNPDSVEDTLQIKMKQGDQWLDVNPEPDTFVVNIGDMLSQWTGGHYRSTPHRVASPVGRDRISVPFFFEPNYEAVIEGVQFGKHLSHRVLSNFSDSPNIHENRSREINAEGTQ